ncbi:MAG: DHH family phosphoesterase [Solobacterium sp.]|nr:DHH family phosphoesterase [Solobacterium sp.]
MHRKISNLKSVLIAAVLIQAALLVILHWLKLELGIIPAAAVLAVEAGLFLFACDRFDAVTEEQTVGVKEVLGETARDAYLYGGIGMVSYDDDHIITWMSDLFEEKGINRVGRKVLVWLPEAEAMLNGSSDTAQVQLDENIYEITKKEDESVLLFRDITKEKHYHDAYDNERPVVGMASLDNYEESTQYEDEARVSAINIAVRTPLTEYCRDHGILIRRMNNYRYLLMLNEKIFSDLAADHFSILNTVRREAQKQDVSITLSMAFARGEDNYQKLDEMVTALMDLAQSRGGDQVAVQKSGEEVKYFGGSTEATEKRSRVRVRVMAHTLQEMITRSSNVIICGHKEQDFDCMGSALAMAKISQSHKKQTVIIARTGGIEEKLKAVLEANEEQLKEEVTFVTENEALNQLQEKTLVIMVDHHNIKQSNGSRVLENANNVAIIDHHRRSTEMGVKPVFVYIEAGASSACELITELLPYAAPQAELSELDATLMLTGMTIDTNRFRIRTGVRTYEAASQLRRLGADPMKTDEYLKDSYEEFAEKTAVLAMARSYPHRTIIVPVSDRVMSRSIMSQIADSILQVQDVDAAFVLANTNEDQLAISARSNGKINVQVIMEALGGGGHMTAAAMQRQKGSVEALEKELAQQLETYFEEAAQDEGNTEN